MKKQTILYDATTSLLVFDSSVDSLGSSVPLVSWGFSLGFIGTGSFTTL